MNIYVGNVAPQATDGEIRAMFEEFGEVTSARLMKDRFSNEPRGFGFVEMTSKSEAINAINEVNGRELHGQQLKVNEARPRTDAPRGGGNRGGGYGGGRRNSW
ncbi:MAG TPA: RNA-binding protein [Spirochaetota bacterium]|nr:RNA-binding protein [Spirochaetota bacterium]